MRISQAGFSLLEMLIAMAIGAVLMLSVGRFLPLLLVENLALQQRVQLQQELQQISQTLQKALRRAGYCNGECSGPALTLSENGSCILLRWDENSNGRWEGVGHSDSDFYGYRLRGGQVEMQRGVDECNSAGWERLTDPEFLTITHFRVERQAEHLSVQLTGKAGEQWVALESWVRGENL
ncbi:prepilin peptidase-dependent protein [Erwiniaceae bacterium L1_54_6]|jgi:prepilin peptidase dependent protein B|uniref:Prepilin-type cleavage/methylation domain-containing protein n=1 Tax=Pantoea cypripedii TaxID=55209 RepID=A0A6B9G8D6_PANCY|nr:prepilin peptidase-dependent protein [Pantoea cypripedii]MDF7662618.1 prepilin peptidase-dependent protein [Erwiniaceae bacterium L1_54_6]QGY30367.1 prepilin-type cleavage/methylation domain-containing protein [Pantoea cypripedii]